MKISILGFIVGIAALIFFGIFIICAMAISGDISNEENKREK